MKLKIFSYILIALSLQGTLTLAASTDQNLTYMTEARKLYGKNNLDKAIETYNKVSKSSDFWTDSVEEKAWAYVRQDNYDKALAEIKSVSNPVFLPFASPETLMLAAFVDLKICDYKGVFEKIKIFKDNIKPRAEALEAISKQPKNDVTVSWIQKMKEKTLTTSDLGQDIQKMPRFFYRDVEIQKLAKQNKITKALNRLKILAKRDLAEISKNLKKMKVIEIEVIQRSFSYDKEQVQGNLEFDKTQSKDALVFPDEQGSGEIWLDEIGKYEVKTMKCPTKAGGRS